jgi:hypothetical protein
MARKKRRLVTRRDAQEMRSLYRGQKSIVKVGKLTGWAPNTVWAYVSGHMRNEFR